MGKRSGKTGLPPGSLVFIGKNKATPANIGLVQYNESELTALQLPTGTNGVAEHIKDGYVNWLNFNGIHDVTAVEALGKEFGLHPLLLEDILNTEKRPKKEEFETHTAIILKSLCLSKDKSIIDTEQIAIIIGSNFIITCQESGNDPFSTVLDRIKSGRGKLRRSGTTYFLYCLLDTIVDNYFVVLEQMGDVLTTLESEISAEPDQTTITKLHKSKRQILALRRAVWPLREIISSLEREMEDDTSMYFRDVYDHTIEIIETIEAYRETLTGLLDLYLSSLSNKTNQVVKVLAIITTIFMPLSLIAGIYGMNFKDMPELDYQYGYPMTILGMLLIALIMLVFFRKKQWL